MEPGKRIAVLHTERTRRQAHVPATVGRSRRVQFRLGGSFDQERLTIAA